MPHTPVLIGDARLSPSSHRSPRRYNSTGKVMPAGMVAGMSAAMTAFYVYRLINPSKLGS